MVDTVDDVVDGWWETFRGVPALDRAFYTASTLGDFSVIWHGVNALRAIAAPDGRARFVRLAAGLAVESVAVNQGVKRVFRRARPAHEGERPHHLRQPTTSSFPSGHASAAAFAVTLLNERGRAKGFVRLLGVLVGTSRVHVRIHHASDVVVGALVGRLLARLWQRVWPLSRRSPS